MFREIFWFYLLFIVLSLFLAFYPPVDIFISDFFYSQENKFLVKHYLTSKEYFYEYIIRRIILPLIVFVLLFFPILLKFFPFLISKLRIFHMRNIDIFFIWLSAIIISFFINVVLKNGWGRARPNDILEFGGEKNFSAWWQYSNECLSNCSFVSGDSGVGFFIAVLYYIHRNNKILYMSLLVGLIFGLVRIGAGAHFLSDILISFLVVNLLLNLIYFVYYNSIK